MAVISCLLIVLYLAGINCQTIDVYPQQPSTFKINPILQGAGIEYINHQIYGALYSQMIFGESLEEQVPSGSQAVYQSIALSSDLSREIRHCNFQLWATQQTSPYSDFDWGLIPALNGQEGAISFKPSAVPGYYMAPYPGLEDGRLGIIAYADTQSYKDSASFKMIPGLANSNQVSFQAIAGTYAGRYITANQILNGTCNYSPPSSDVALVAKPDTNAHATWVLQPQNYPPDQQGYFGCFQGRTNDTKLTQNITDMWMGVVEGSASPSWSIGKNNPFHGAQYQHIEFQSGQGRVGISNFGLNCQHGFYFLANQLYEGYIYLRSTTSPIPTIQISLEDTVTGEILASTHPTLTGVNQWTKVNLSFTPRINTICDGYDTWLGGAKQNLNQCSGSFVVSLLSQGTLDVDLAYLSPGSWGLRPSPTAGTLGLPARKDIADALQFEGLKNLRMGGTMCNDDEYRWKYFRGPRDFRPPYHGYWYPEPGLTQSRGFGIFEIIDLCSAIGCIPVITFNNLESPSDMADFVEYCWGDATTTTWGKQRAQDGHPEVYDVKIVEIGNEQPLTTSLLDNLIDISNAMDKKAQSLGLSFNFSYYIGENLDSSQLTGDSLNIVKQFLNRTLPLQDRIFWDLHVGADPDSVPYWDNFLTQFQSIVNSMGSKLRIGIFEENGGDHDLLRGLGHATYSSMMHKHGDFAQIHGYANCLQAWQGMDEEQAFPQGQLYSLPNMTWGQPTYLVIQLVNQTLQPFVIPAKISSGSNIDVVGVLSEDKKIISVRVVNWGSSFKANVILHDLSSLPTQVELSIMRGTTGENSEENSPSQPTRIKIYESSTNYSQNTTYDFGANTYTILTFRL